MWQELIRATCSRCSFAPPASAEQLSAVSVALATDLPTELRSLLHETNGAKNEDGEGIWSTEEIILRNSEMRSGLPDNLYMPFAHALFFAESVNGSLFFFPIQHNGRINRPDVLEWEHETNSRTWIAGHLQWFGDELTV